jgi:hypothetical protein
MAGWESIRRSAIAAEKRAARESVQRQREFERRAKEQAKLSALEQAKLEVETHENKFEVLLSVHKEQGELWDWSAIGAKLPPPEPKKSSRHEQRAKQNAAVVHPEQRSNLQSAFDPACHQDTEEFRQSVLSFTDEHRDRERFHALARRVCAGDVKAYAEVLENFSPLLELAHFGSSIDFTFHSSRLIECSLSVTSSHAVPNEIKILTASGKVSVKAMPLARLHEIYQDHVCSCILRVARETFALLPIDTVLITAATAVFDSATGTTAQKPVLSTALTRAQTVGLNFALLDPSDAIETFLHRGEFKATRKSGAFLPITPLTPKDLGQMSLESQSFSELLATVQTLRNGISDERGELPQIDSKTKIQR